MEVHQQVGALTSCNASQVIVRGLYEKHKFLFTLLLALKIDMNLGNVSFAEFSLFLKGGASLDLNSVKVELFLWHNFLKTLSVAQFLLIIPQPKPFKWMLDVVWLNLVELSKQKTFREILSAVVGAEKEWKKWFDTDSPEEEDIPCGYQVPDRLSFCFLPLPKKPHSGFIGRLPKASAHPLLLPR